MKKPKHYLKRDPVTDEEWDEQAKYLGVESGAILKAQVKLADEILAEILAEENQANNESKD